MNPSPIVVADVGKSSTRLAVYRDNMRNEFIEGPGIDGLTHSRGALLAAERIDALGARLKDIGPALISVGVAGALTAPTAASELARLLAQRWSAPASVTSDVVTAHLGALNGRGGTLLIAGTGAVALSIRDDSTLQTVDGIGPELGDRGSGYWIGRRGLRAALSEGASTALVEMAKEHLHHMDPPQWLARQERPVAAVAGFAPAVLDAAESGDAESGEICIEAISELTATARLASEPGDHVTVLGGLTSNTWFLRSLHDSLSAAALQPLPPVGSAMHGAQLAATRNDFPHERLIHRVS